MNNWIETYGKKPEVRKFQEGGAMPATPAAQAGQGGQEGGEVQLDQMLAQYAQSRDPQLAVAICDALVEMMAQQGGGAPMAKCGAKMKAGGKGPVFRKMVDEKAAKKEDKKKKK